MKKAVMAWSGGKDSAFSLYKVLQQKEYDVSYLVTTVSATYNRVSMHGVRAELLEQQAEAIGIPLIKLLLPEPCSMEQYADIMKNHWATLEQEGIDYIIFGDIFLEDLKEFRDKNLAACGVTGVYPIWKKNSKKLIHDFLNAGFKTTLVCTNEKYLDKEWCGRVIDEKFVADLPDNVDPCGENGEFHTFVFDGPVFKQPVKFEHGETIHRNYSTDTEKWDTGFFYLDLLPATVTI